jgi:hypothetical protein
MRSVFISLCGRGAFAVAILVSPVGALAQQRPPTPPPQRPAPPAPARPAPPAARPESPYTFRGFFSFGTTSLSAAETFEAVLGSSSIGAIGGGGEVNGLWKKVFVRFDVSRSTGEGSRALVVDGTPVSLGVPLRVGLTPIEITAGWRHTFMTRARPAAPAPPRPPAPPAATPARPGATPPPATPPRTTPPPPPQTPPRTTPPPQAPPQAPARPGQPPAAARPSMVPSRFSVYGGGGPVFLKYSEESDFAVAGENVNTSFTGFVFYGGLSVDLTKLLYANGEVGFRTVPDAIGAGGLSAVFGENNLGGFVLRALVGVRFKR